MSVVTASYLHSFKAGDLVDVRIMRSQWSGPHRLLVYKIEGSPTNGTQAAYLEVELGEKKLQRWLLLGDQGVIRQHKPAEHKQNRLRQIPQPTPETK